MANPHGLLIRTNPIDQRGQYRCEYCDARGTIEELCVFDCTHIYPPCDHCGQTPVCAPDCAGIAAALSAPGVHVIR